MVLLFRSYLEITRFKIPADHDPLKWILNFANVAGKLARWLLRLSEMYFDVIHCAGIKLQAADALLRLPTTGEDCKPIEDRLPVM